MSKLNNLRQMMELQDQMNSVVNPKWKTANYKWLRAAWIECAELMDFCQWKWWKKQERNLAQAQIELVDIWHFLLSHAILQGVSAEDLLFSIESDPNFYDEEQDVLEIIEDFVFLTVDEMSGDAYYSTFFAICDRLELDFNTLTRMYIGKNVLNIFRQDNGYKTGDYIKDWPSLIEPKSTLEDNVFLEIYLKEADTLGIQSSDLFDYVYQRLTDNYPGE